MLGGHCTSSSQCIRFRFHDVDSFRPPFLFTDVFLFAPEGKQCTHCRYGSRTPKSCSCQVQPVPKARDVRCRAGAEPASAAVRDSFYGWSRLSFQQMVSLGRRLRGKQPTIERHEAAALKHEAKRDMQYLLARRTGAESLAECFAVPCPEAFACEAAGEESTEQGEVEAPKAARVCWAPYTLHCISHFHRPSCSRRRVKSPWR